MCSLEFLSTTISGTIISVSCCLQFNDGWHSEGQRNREELHQFVCTKQLASRKETLVHIQASSMSNFNCLVDCLFRRIFHPAGDSSCPFSYACIARLVVAFSAQSFLIEFPSILMFSLIFHDFGLNLKCLHGVVRDKCVVAPVLPFLLYCTCVLDC